MPIRLANWVQKGENKRKTFFVIYSHFIVRWCGKVVSKSLARRFGGNFSLFVFRLVDKFSHLDCRWKNTFLLSVYFSKAFSNPKCFIVGCCGVSDTLWKVQRDNDIPQMTKFIRALVRRKSIFYVGKSFSFRNLWSWTTVAAGEGVEIVLWISCTWDSSGQVCLPFG